MLSRPVRTLAVVSTLAMTVLASSDPASPGAQQRSQGCATNFSQCNGQHWPHGVCCIDPTFTCQEVTQYLSLCVPKPASIRVGLYGQCGGLAWRGPVDCVDDSTCVVVNDYYSHCFPNPASTGAPTTAPTRASTTSVAPSLAQDPVDCDDDDDTIGFHNEDGLLTNLTIDEINALYTATYLEARGPALGPYAQCGGLKWAGQTVCVQGFYCRAQSEYFSQCVPIPDLPGIPTYGQCGGQYWTGPTECQVGTTCKVESKWYSQCLPTAY
ncbi:hypothetical protein H310_09802 [Aphanomyces invadans]|uniref:CBM1 domain-containing protein n=1 Tax=Aphanomyces invadans TaxID=157072 RepID=A0A024TS35_9STRA|nr:hypothetical protein H310_09802 [Aphanomyces invadans]ETV96940.1 hypothetical protein H310_09802 [Aphanomyces invadans]|eukprot:XP_008874186.1 hypothetical protein H310_09802 [Aphanomyces invadans]